MNRASVTPPPAPTQQADEAKASGTLARARDAFFRGFINLKTMPLSSRIPTLAGFGLLGLVALALAVFDLPQPRVAVPFQLNGQTTETSWVAFVVVAVVGGIGCAYALAGAMSLRWLPRLIVVTVVTGVLLEVPLLSFQPSLSTGDSYLVITTVIVPAAQFVLLAALWLWALGVSLARWRMTHARSATAIAPARHVITPLVVALALIVVFFGLDLIPWAIGHITSAAMGPDEDVILVGELAAPLGAFALIAPLFVFWFSTDSTEWSTTLAAGFARLTGRISWLMPATTALVAVAIGADALRLAGLQIIPPLIAAAVLAALVAFLVTLGPPPAHWPDKVPLSALAAATITLFAVLTVPIVTAESVAAVGNFSPQSAPMLMGATTVVVILLAIFLGLALAAWGRLRDRGNFASIGLMMMLVAATFFIAQVGQLQTDLGISWVPQPKHIQAGIESLLVLATLGLLVGLLLRRRPLADVTAALTGPLIALIGLQAINWYSTFLIGRLNASPGSVTVVAAFFLASQLWDVARSGGPITNGDSLRAPRVSRVLVYFGYTLLAAALFLFASSLRVTTTGAAVPQYLFSSDNSTFIAALLVLCVPLAMVTGFTRFQQWRATAVVAVAAPRHHGREGVLFGGVVGTGGALIAVTAVILISLVAHAPHSPASTYSTNLPGPNCDTHGASWPVTASASVRCQPDGLYVTAPGFQTTYVGFRPPGGYTTSNYRVSVHLDLGNSAGTAPGCAGIATRLSANGEYQGIICSSGAWALRRIDLVQGTTTALAFRIIAPSQTYTLSMTSAGATHSLAVNGVQVASATDPTFGAGGLELVVVNVAAEAETAAFSDFTYTPLD